MTVIYANSVATGANNGTSYVNGYTNLQDGLNALAATLPANPDSVLYGNAPWHTPFKGSFNINAVNNFQIRLNEGPDKETVVFGGLTNAGWTDQTGGVFRVALGAEPQFCGYYQGQDDYLGTLSGCVITAEVAAYCAYVGWHPSKARAWPIFLAKAGSPTTTPTEGQYSYTGGFLYVNPPGAPTLAQVIVNTYYSNSAQVHGLNVISCQNWDVIGLTSFFYPVVAGNFGYGYRGDNCVRGRFIRCDAHVSGWHGGGFAGASGGYTGDYDVQLVNCLSNGVTCDEAGASFSINNFVFYQHSNPARWGNNYGTGLLAIPNPRLLTTGRPVITNWVANAFLAHSNVGSDLKDIIWRRSVSLDFTDPICAKHTITNPNIGVLCEHSNGPAPTDVNDVKTYAAQLRQVVSYGRSGLSKSNQVSYDRVLVDRIGHGLRSIGPLHGFTFVFITNLKGCTVLTGNCARAFVEVTEANDWVKFDGGNYLLCQKDDGAIGFRCALAESSTDNTGDNIFIGGGLRLDGSGNGALHNIVRAGNFTIYTNGPRDVVSDGTNIFGTNLEGGWGRESQNFVPNTLAYYLANVAGASTDLINQNLNWGLTETEKANTLRRLWLDENKLVLRGQ